MTARQKQQGRREDHHRQQLHVEQVVQAEAQHLRRQPSGGQGDDAGQGGAQGHGGDGRAECESEQAGGSPHVQRGAAQTPRQKGGGQHLNQVEHGVDKGEDVRLAAEHVADQIDRKTADQNRQGRSSVKLQYGGQQDGVGRPHDHDVQRAQAPLAQKLTGREQQDIGPCGRARRLTGVMAEEPPPSAPQGLRSEPHETDLGRSGLKNPHL